MALLSPWVALLRRLDPNVPASDEQYEEPGYSCAGRIADQILSDPAGRFKYLLIGARGGGKSSELRRIARLIREHRLLVDINLDASQINALTIGADDLAYLCGVGLLRHMRSHPQAEAFFHELKAAYTDGEDPDELGSLQDALEGLATFSLAAGAAAEVGGLAPGGSVAGAVVAGVMGKFIALLPRRDRLVTEESPQGRRIIQALQNIVRSLRDQNRPPPVLLVDGLEKMNGESAERLVAVFQYTRLLADLPLAAVYAAPPSTLTVTNSLESVGWRTRVVWGFGAKGADRLVRVMERRFRTEDLDPVKKVEAGLLLQIATASGGIPRHTMEICSYAVDNARFRGSDRLEATDVQAATLQRAQELGRGLHEEHIATLKKVLSVGLLPGSDSAARLFTDGRILAVPPDEAPEPVGQRFRVHPLLEAWVRGLSTTSQG